jgi:hypothetical protein
MEEYIIVETRYGDVKLVKHYDVDTSSSFYDVYDEADNHLGELWHDLPAYDACTNQMEMIDALEQFTDLVEDAINDNTLAIPLSKEPTTDKVWIATICICKYGKALAYSEPFKTQDNALDYRQNEVEKWIKDSGVEIDPIQTMSSGVFMEMSDELRNLIFTATIKETEIK